MRYVRLDLFLPYLADGWRFASWVVEPMGGPHGFWSVLMERDQSPPLNEPAKPQAGHG